MGTELSIVDEGMITPTPVKPPAPKPDRKRRRFEKRRDRYTASMFRSVSEREMAEIWRAIARDAMGGEDVPPAVCMAARKMIMEYGIGRPVAIRDEDGPSPTPGTTPQSLLTLVFGDQAPTIRPAS